MNYWMRLLHDVFLIQLLRRDGREDAGDKPCPGCADPASDAIYRCQECAGEVLLCQTCCVRKHADNPLHVIYVRGVRPDCRDNGLTCELCYRNGTAYTSRKRLSLSSTSAFNLGIPRTSGALTQSPDTRTSW